MRSRLALAGAAVLVALTGLVSPAAASSPRPTPVVPAPTTRPAPVAPSPPTPAARPFVTHYVQHVDTRDPVVFITVDDGSYPDRAFLARVRRDHLPVTVFLTNAAAGGARADYFRALQSAGAVIEDHTLRHPDLTRVSASTRREEVCGAADRDRSVFGHRATLLRPPYGAWNAAVMATARACGLHAVVGWDAVMPASGGLQTWNGAGRLHAGDIVLLHFVPGLDGQIARLLAVIRAQHLRVALLEDYV